ncbi:MAG: glycosyltransferase [Pseudomonadota bacterium]
MKILVVSQADIHGGAARAATRLHRGFIEQGYRSTMLVARRAGDDQTVVGPRSGYANTWADVRNYLAAPLHALHNANDGGLQSFNILPSGMHKKINAMDVDIVNLHWVNREMMSIAEIGKIRHPIVWTLHDMWAFSGAGHYEHLEYPNRYLSGYTKDNVPAGSSRLDRWVYRRKKRHWTDRAMHFVTPSGWLAECVRRSELLQGRPVTQIQNCLDLQTFRPLDRDKARELLGLPRDRRFLLFAAMFSSSDTRKGYKQLQSALQLCESELNELELLVMGASEPLEAEDMGFPVRYLGKLQDELSAALVYAAADALVAPSLQDNLPNTVLEALACGTPCVAFDTGGLPDLIQHRRNGALATAFSAESLAEQIIWLLQSEEYEQLCQRARAGVEKMNSTAVVTRQYESVFRDALENTTHSPHHRVL